MPLRPSVAGLGDFLFALTEEISDQQARLDKDYQERLQAYLPLLEEARALGYETFARELAPAAMVFTNTEISLQFRFAQSIEQQFALKVQLLDLGFMRRYAHSQFAQNSLQVNVLRIPWSPKPAPNSKLQPPV